MPRRLFVAVIPPAPVVTRLDAFVEPRRQQVGNGAEPQLRWVASDHWHLTLAFLGDVTDDGVANLVPKLDRVAATATPFSLDLGGAGCFPNPDAARVLWLGVGLGAPELGHLARRTRTAAARAGIAVEGGRYRPHLTLARSNRGFQARRWLGVLDSFGGFAWEVGGFVLLDSDLTRGGPRYRVVEEFSFGANLT